MDPRCLHTTSANVSPRPRLTMRTTCMRRGRAKRVVEQMGELSCEEAEQGDTLRSEG